MKVAAFDLNLTDIGSLKNKSTLLQVMAWCQAGGKPLPESMLTKIYDPKWCHVTTFGPEGERYNHFHTWININ